MQGFDLTAFPELTRLSQDPSRIHQVPLFFVGFSAGVVGAIGAARLWHQWGGQVQGLAAFDGWGVPLWGDFPIYRISHDAFTHWSSALLGAGQASFYAEPPVSHLALWRSPETVQGWSNPAIANVISDAALGRSGDRAISHPFPHSFSHPAHPAMRYQSNVAGFLNHILDQSQCGENTETFF
ncbi:MAG: hypothetical protein MUF49_18805 [Oculatellaceae cyanobacterium Prado106]|nr:hypothetical protein [Oculatellaceae cyanobacterium Prado106]